MASIAMVIPAAGHINEIYGIFLGVLAATDLEAYQSETQDVLEMRFTLRTFLGFVMELTKHDRDSKDEYLNAARRAGLTPDSLVDGESIGTRTGDALIKILEDAPWGLAHGTKLEQQELNVSLKGIRDAIDVTIKHLSEWLQQDGVDHLEYDGQPASSSTSPATPHRSSTTAQAPSTPSRRGSRGSGNFGHAKGRVWSTEEDLELLRVVRDMPTATHGQRATEFNRRMARQGMAETRSREAFRLHTNILGNSRITITDLERALSATTGAGNGA